jgi:hypothetical protein
MPKYYAAPKIRKVTPSSTQEYFEKIFMNILKK